MHPSSYALMERLLDHYAAPSANVLDVGAFDVNGTYRPLVEKRGWRYTGLDIVPGANVDWVADAPYAWGGDDGVYDVVLCGNMLHNVAHPHLLVPEMTRVLRPGGLLILITVTWNKPPSLPYPLDCWRFMPDGLWALLNSTGVLTHMTIAYDGAFDIYALAWKQGDR